MMYERSQRNGLCLKLGPKQLADENKSKSCKEVNENNNTPSLLLITNSISMSAVKWGINKNVVWWAPPPSWCEPDIMNWRGTQEASFTLIFVWQTVPEKVMLSTIQHTTKTKSKSRGIRGLFVKGEEALYTSCTTSCVPICSMSCIHVKRWMFNGSMDYKWRNFVFFI